jgi:Kef-type K+ transport system membrane component KefB
MHDVIHDIALSIITAWLLGVLARLLHQPVFLAYLVAGFIVGPFGGRFITSQESIRTIAELGLIFLLFMIGLEIDLKKVARAGHSILITGAVQIAGGLFLGLLFFMFVGLPIVGQRWDGLYLAVAAALSSTVIIVTILYEKRELDTLPGRITLGVLVLQDVFVILFMTMQPSLDDLQPLNAIVSVAQVVALILSSLLISRYVLPYLFHRVARLPELIVVGALAWCFFVAEIAVLLDLSRAMGALVAGVALSTFPYALDVTAKVTGLRDFFITLFFVALGMMIPVPTLNVLSMALVLAAFTVFSRLLTTFVPLYIMRHGLRASLLPAINLAQLSEFSLVLLQLGVNSNHIANEVAGATSLAFAALAVLSTFVILRSDEIVRWLIVVLKRIGIRDLDHKRTLEPEGRTGPGQEAKIVLLGFYKAASSLYAELERQRPDLLNQICVVDFNPSVYNTLSARGQQVQYADLSHRGSLVHTSIAEAKIVISSVPDSLLKGTSNERIVRDVRGLNAGTKIIASAETLSDVQRLYQAGADYVVIGRFAIADQLVDAISAAESGLLQDRRAELDVRLDEHRNEVLS